MPVVARSPESSGRPVDEEDTAEDRCAWYWPEVAAVLRFAAVVAENEVLLGSEMGGWDVVGLSSIGEDALVATDDRVAGDADHALGEV